MLFKPRGIRILCYLQSGQRDFSLHPFQLASVSNCSAYARWRDFTASTSIHNEQETCTTSANEPSEQEIEEYVRDVRNTWGDHLPEGLLNAKEFSIYERYFGKPIRMLKEGEELHHEEIGVDLGSPGMPVGSILESAEGVEVNVQQKVVQVSGEEEGTWVVGDGERDAVFVGIGTKADQQLVRDIERAVQQYQPEEEEDPEYDPDEENGVDDDDDLPDDSIRGTETPYFRSHPLTQLGRFATFPSTVTPPTALTRPTTEFLSKISKEHIRDAAHKLFGNEKLIYSPIATPKKKNDYSKFPIHPSDPTMTDLEADVHLATVMPGLHAQALSALAEVRRRLGRDWVLNDVKRVLDVGTAGAGVIAWNSIVKAEQDINKEVLPQSSSETSNSAVLALKAVVVTASPALRYRASKMLENTVFLPRLPDTKPTMYSPPMAPEDPNQVLQPRKTYDLIIATNTILPIEQEFKRKYHVQNLWSLLNPKGGVLVLIEKGNPSGFMAIAAARSHLLKYNIAFDESELSSHSASATSEELYCDERGNPLPSKQPRQKEIGQIIAPCTNHAECPMHLASRGRTVSQMDFCRFAQRYIRPQYMQRIVNATFRNHEDAEFSYLAVRRGIDHRFTNPKEDSPIQESGYQNGDKERKPVIPDPAEFDLSTTPVTSSYSEEQLRSYFFTLPRILSRPIKSKGHIILDLCTNEGKVERWTVPKSYSRLAFRDAKASEWGDLWALGAKTKLLRIGTKEDGILATAKKTRKRVKPTVINLDFDGNIVRGGNDVGARNGPGAKAVARDMRKFKERIQRKLAKEKGNTRLEGGYGAGKGVLYKGKPLWRKERTGKLRREREQLREEYIDYS